MKCTDLCHCLSRTTFRTDGRLNWFLPHYTSSVVGHDQEAVVVDAERLPVQGWMCLQCLVMQETTLLNIPLIDNRQFRFHLLGICHHHENLKKKKSVTGQFHRNCYCVAHALARPSWLVPIAPRYMYWVHIYVQPPSLSYPHTHTHTERRDITARFNS